MTPTDPDSSLFDALVANALSHLQGALQRLLAGTCGIVIRLGAPATPQARAKIEARFKLQAQRVLHQLPSTTGSGPQDPVRKKAEAPVKQRVLVDALEHVLDVYQANENATPAAAAGYEAPLERLRRQLEAQAIKRRSASSTPSARGRPRPFLNCRRGAVRQPTKRRRPNPCHSASSACRVALSGASEGGRGATGGHRASQLASARCLRSLQP